MENFTLSPLVPQELMEEILLRLPVKSLLRFKCVCNSWLSLISNPQFAQLHFDLDAAPTHRVLVNLTNDHIESVDIDDDSAGVFLRFPHPPSPLLVLQFFGSCSCRGFLLVNNIAYGVLNLIVWNPSTGVHKRIPDPDFDFRTREYLCGFGYDASKDDYLVTFIIFDEDEDAFPPKHQRAMIKLFSLKTNSWDCIYIDIRCFCLRLLQTYYNNIAGSFLFGALHWLVFSKDKFVILAFNLMERRLFEIPLPHDLTASLRYYPHGLRVIGGCLGVWCSNYAMGRRGEMWIMKEYQVLASWSRSFCFSDDEPYVKFSPICLTRDNALLGSGINSLRKLCGETGQWLSDHFTYDERGKFNIYNRHCALYRESLLSLPTDSGERTQDEQESRYPIDPWE